MTSSEADKFMRKHPEVAVKVLGGGLKDSWVAWNYIDDGDLCNRAMGFTRQHAIAEYKRIYHPKEPPYHFGPMERDIAAQKYRQILEEYKAYRRRTNLDSSTSPGNSIFAHNVFNIIKDDLKPTHCDKCHQELP